MVESEVEHIGKIRVYSVTNGYKTLEVGLTNDVYFGFLDALTYQCTDGQFYIFRVDLMTKLEFETMVKNIALQEQKTQEEMAKYNDVAKQTNLRKFKLLTTQENDDG